MTTRATHTPGPWGINSYAPVMSHIGITSKDGEVATVSGHGFAGNASNAALIAAAPSMATYIAKRAALGDTEAVAILQEIEGIASLKDSKARSDR